MFQEPLNGLVMEDLQLLDLRKPENLSYREEDLPFLLDTFFEEFKGEVLEFFPGLEVNVTDALKDLRDFVDGRMVDTYLFTYQGLPIGFSVGIVKDWMFLRNSYFIQLFFIKPDHRGKKLGSIFLDRLKVEVKMRYNSQFICYLLLTER